MSTALRKSNGLILMYVGRGKGKTTAAVGLAVRAAGAGKRVLFAQFVKSPEKTEAGEWQPSSEIVSLERLGIATRALGRGFVGILGDRKKRLEHIRSARQGLSWLRRQIISKKFDVVIADELVSAIELKLLTVSQVKAVCLLARRNLFAFALTGHNTYTDLRKTADLVSEMKMVKHPYYQGILAQRGIDY